MAITVSGRAGVYAARPAVEAGKSASERVTIHRHPMAGKIVINSDWDLLSSTRTALNARVRVSYLASLF